IYQGIEAAWDGYHQVAAVRAGLAADTEPSAPAEVAQQAKAFEGKLDTLAGNPERGRGFFRGGPQPPPNFVGVNAALVRQLNSLDLADMAPTQAMLDGYATVCGDLKTVVTAWQTARTRDLSALNALLTKNGRPAVSASGAALEIPVCGAGARAGTGVAAGRRANAPSPEDDPDETP
ncbi:MAG: hypothetical protein ACM37V_07700, partial [Gemmatimonadota bacterium]